MAKISKEKFKVYKNVFDNHTLRILEKFSNRGHFLELSSPIFIGKESNVFSAVTDDGRYVIVKIYRVENCNFNKMFDYIKQDPRFIGIRKQRRQIIFAWVQREYRNLLKAREGGVTVPLPIAVQDNVLILEYIGHDEIDPPEVSPQLKNSQIDDPEDFFNQVLDNMKKLHKIGLVHADLSAFNILNKDQTAYLIDYSQATTIDCRDYYDLLRRDIKNVCQFFRKVGLELSEDDVFDQITKD